jgi:hypothetical protein
VVEAPLASARRPMTGESNSSRLSLRIRRTRKQTPSERPHRCWKPDKLVPELFLVRQFPLIGMRGVFTLQQSTVDPALRKVSIDYGRVVFYRSERNWHLARVYLRTPTLVIPTRQSCHDLRPSLFDHAPLAPSTTAAARDMESLLRLPRHRCSGLQDDQAGKKSYIRRR